MINEFITLATSIMTTPTDVTSNPLFGFAEYGILGLSVIALTIALIRKDRQVNMLYIRLIEKAERDADKYHELAEALDETLKELIDAIEFK